MAETPLSNITSPPIRITAAMPPASQSIQIGVSILLYLSSPNIFSLLLPKALAAQGLGPNYQLPVPTACC